jgi:hypothetical protein
MAEMCCVRYGVGLKAGGGAGDGWMGGWLWRFGEYFLGSECDY